MSSYIVEYITMHRVASYVARERKILWNEKKMKVLIKKLWNMNVKALIARYGESEEKANKQWIKDYKFEYQELPKENFEETKKLMLFFKSFCNYTYQCAEGDVPKSRFYKEIMGYEDDLAHKISTSIPEWGQGKWE